MDVNSVRILFTVWIFISFVLVVYIAYSKRNKQNYDQASQSIIDDDDNVK